MSAIWMCLGIGLLFGCGCYLAMSRNLARVLPGIILISQGANLLVFASGGIVSGRPPLIAEGDSTLTGTYADPLPQALVLTAIVIGFAVLAFAISLVLRAYDRTRSSDLDTYNSSDR